MLNNKKHSFYNAYLIKFNKSSTLFGITTINPNTFMYFTYIVFKYTLKYKTNPKLIFKLKTDKLAYPKLLLF